MNEMRDNLPALSEEIENKILAGDYSKLTEAEAGKFQIALCDQLKISHISKPFDFIRMQGKLVLYANKSCTDQLRKVWGVSVKVTEKSIDTDAGLITFTALATMPNGRTDESIAVVPCKGMSGANLANAIMKCETKAKRRVTLSICGLAITDETELDTMKEVSFKTPFTEMGDMNEILNEDDEPRDVKDTKPVERTTTTDQDAPPQPDAEPEKPAKTYPKEEERMNHAPVSQDQIKRLFTIIGASDLTQDEARELLLCHFNLDSTKKLTMSQYEILCNMIEKEDADDLRNYMRCA